MSVQSRYRASYDQIAADHVKFWRETGRNPFQEESVLRHNELSTEHYIRTYAPEGYWLDAACGMGDLLMRFPDRERMGIDISLEYIEIAQERGLDVGWAEIQNMRGIPTQTFDLVTATDVLEHVLDLNRTVKELLRVLKPGGILITRTPFAEKLSISSEPYEFVHLRSFDYSTLFLLFRKIFDCEVLDIPQDMDIIHAVVRK